MERLDARCFCLLSSSNNSGSSIFIPLAEVPVLFTSSFFASKRSIRSFFSATAVSPERISPWAASHTPVLTNPITDSDMLIISSNMEAAMSMATNADVDARAGGRSFSKRDARGR